MRMKEEVKAMIEKLQNGEELLRAEDIVFFHKVNIEEECAVAGQITTALLHLGKYKELGDILRKSKKLSQETKDLLLGDLVDYQAKYRR